MTEVTIPSNPPEMPLTWEHKGHYVEIVLTVFNAHRVTIREKGDFYLKANWCAGKGIEDVQKLLGLAKAVLDADKDFPQQSRVKPYFNCEHFTRWMGTVEFEPFKFNQNQLIGGYSNNVGLWAKIAGATCKEQVQQ